jgi:chemotaxis protein MotB
MAKKDEHHGGAWKVAYADFVTAMMALFIVLWIIKSKPELAEVIAASFRKPLFGYKGGSPAEEIKDLGVDQRDLTDKQLMDRLQRIAAEMQKMMESDRPEESPMEVTVTSDGLTVNLFDRSKRPLFERGTAQLTAWGQFVFEGLSWIIERKKMVVFIEGHVVEGGGNAQPNYGMWELSSDRANAVRKSLISYALEPMWIKRLTGYGDSQPLESENRGSERNQRITLKLSILK